MDYKAFEHRLLAAVHMRFSLPIPSEALEKKIKHADRLSAWYEATQLAGFTEEEAAKFFPRPRFKGAGEIRLATEPTSTVKQAFLARFEELAA